MMELEHQWYTCATVQPYSNNSPIKIIMTVVRKIYFYSTTFGHIKASSPSHSKLSENSIISTVQLKPLSIHNLWLVFEVLLFETGLSLTGLTLILEVLQMEVLDISLHNENVLP